MNNTQKKWAGAAFVALALGLLVRFGAVAGSEAAGNSYVFNFPAVSTFSLPSMGAARAVFAPEENQGDGLLGGLVHNTQESFDAGIAVNGTQVISSTGTIAFGGSTPIAKHYHGQYTIDPSAITQGAVTTSVLTLTGVAIGDSLNVGLTGNWGGAVSSSVRVTGSVTAADTVTLYFFNSTNTSVNVSGTVFNVDTWF